MFVIYIHILLVCSYKVLQKSSSLVAASCPQHSHFEMCADTCVGTCAGFISPYSCSKGCFEGCQCDDGFVFDGNQCVRLERCGCLHKGRYLTVKLNVFYFVTVLQLNGSHEKISKISA